MTDFFRFFLSKHVCFTYSAKHTEHAYNIFFRNQRSCGVRTPCQYYLVHGREARKFIDLVTEHPKRYTGVEDCDLTDLEIINEARSFAKNLIEASQLKAKQRYDSERVESTYKVGDLVLMKKQANQIKGSKKFSFPYEGPYKVIRRLNDVNIQIASVEYPGEQHIVHVAQVKPYYLRHSARSVQDNPSDSYNEATLKEDEFESSRDNFRIPEYWFNRPLAPDDITSNEQLIRQA